MAPGAAASQDLPEHEHVVVDEWERVSIRRAPQYGRFLGVGIGVGLLLAIIATIVTVNSGTTYLQPDAAGSIRAFGVYAVLFVGGCLALSGIAAITADRVMGRRRRIAEARHRVTIVDDLASPVGDEPPRWTQERE